jgi:hypothetical protein
MSWLHRMHWKRLIAAAQQQFHEKWASHAYSARGAIR